MCLGVLSGCSGAPSGSEWIHELEAGPRTCSHSCWKRPKARSNMSPLLDFVSALATLGGVEISPSDVPPSQFAQGEPLSLQVLDLMSDNESVAPSDEYSLYIKQLGESFDELLAGITRRVDKLSNETLTSVQARHVDISTNNLVQLDNDLHKIKSILKQCDELESEFTKVRYIKEICVDFKRRLNILDENIA